MERSLLGESLCKFWFRTRAPIGWGRRRRRVGCWARTSSLHHDVLILQGRMLHAFCLSLGRPTVPRRASSWAAAAGNNSYRSLWEHVVGTGPGTIRLLGVLHCSPLNENVFNGKTSGV